MNREEINREWYEAIRNFQKVPFQPQQLKVVDAFIQKLTTWLDAVNDERNRLQDKILLLERENAALKEKLEQERDSN